MMQNFEMTESAFGLVPMPTSDDIVSALASFDGEGSSGRHNASSHRIYHSISRSNGTHGPGRSLLADTYGDSLRHANSLMNKAFGSASRKVPAHMCHFLDRNILGNIRKRCVKLSLAGSAYISLLLVFTCGRRWFIAVSDALADGRRNGMRRRAIRFEARVICSSLSRISIS